MDRFGPRFGRVGRRRVVDPDLPALAAARRSWASPAIAQSADVGVIAALALLDRVRLGLPGHRHRRLRGRGAGALASRASPSGRARRSRARRCSSPARVTITAGPAAGLAAGRSRPGAALRPAGVRRALVAGARVAARPPPRSLRQAVFDPLIELFRRVGRAADPRLPRPLQVRREPRHGAHPAVPHPEVLRAGGRRRRRRRRSGSSR